MNYHILPDVPPIEEDEEKGCPLCREVVRIVVICVLALLVIIGILSVAKAGSGRRIEPPMPENLVVGEKVYLPTSQVCTDKERAVELVGMLAEGVSVAEFTKAWQKAMDDGVCGAMPPTLWLVKGVVVSFDHPDGYKARLIHLQLDLADGSPDGMLDFYTLTNLPVVEVTVLRYKELLGCSLQSKEMHFPTMEACMQAAMVFISLDEVVDAACYHYSVKERGI